MERLRIIPALHRATHRVGLFLQKRTPHASQGEAHLLAHLHEHDGEATVAELHRAWAHRRSTLTDMLDRLERRGLVRRTPSEQDRRSVRIRVTAKGSRLAAGVHAELVALEAQLIGRAGDRAVRSFAAVTEDIAGTAEELARAEGTRARPRRRAAS